jgi:hypothetical protein
MYGPLGGNTWKTATAVLGTLLVVTNAWWLYVATDHAVTKSYRDQVLFEQCNRVLALSAFADEFVRGMGRTETRGSAETAVIDARVRFQERRYQNQPRG